MPADGGGPHRRSGRRAQAPARPSWRRSALWMALVPRVPTIVCPERRRLGERHGGVTGAHADGAHGRAACHRGRGRRGKCRSRASWSGNGRSLSAAWGRHRHWTALRAVEWPAPQPLSVSRRRSWVLVTSRPRGHPGGRYLCWLPQHTDGSDSHCLGRHSLGDVPYVWSHPTEPARVGGCSRRVHAATRTTLQRGPSVATGAATGAATSKEPRACAPPVGKDRGGTVGDVRYLLHLHGAKRWCFSPRAGGERHGCPRQACQADHSLAVLQDSLRTRTNGWRRQFERMGCG